MIEAGQPAPDALTYRAPGEEAALARLWADGPILLERGPATSPLFTAFFEAVQEAGYELTKDVNGYRQEGFAPFDRTISRGRRVSM